LPSSVLCIDLLVFINNRIKYLDFTNFTSKEYCIEGNAFAINLLEEIKISGIANMRYISSDEDDMWNMFINIIENIGKPGDYKYENNKWKWYPL